MIDVHPVSVADLRQREAKAVVRIDLRRLQAVQQQVHLAEQVRQRLGLAAEDTPLLDGLPVLNRLALLFEMRVGLHQKPAGAAGGIEHGFAEPRVQHLDHEPHHRARRVELAILAGGVAHLLEHRLVEMAQGEHLLLRQEVDAVHLVDHVAQQVAGDHVVRDAGEHGRDHLAPPAVSVAAAKPAQVGEQPRSLLAVREHGLFLVDERQEFRAGDAVFLGRPVAPAVRLVDGGAVLLAAQFRPRFLDLFHVVQELQEHDPGEHRQAVEVAGQPLVLPHDVAGGFDQAAQLLRRGERRL